VPKVASEEGISVGTLYNWLKQVREQGVAVPGSQRTSSEDWDGVSKFAAVLETASMTAHELSEYCRQKGLYPEQIARWKAASIAGVAGESSQSSASKKALKEAQQQINHLKKDLNRKEKALAESAALLLLQKKYQALWEDEAS